MLTQIHDHDELEHSFEPSSGCPYAILLLAVWNQEHCHIDQKQGMGWEESVGRRQETPTKDYEQEDDVRDQQP